MKRQLKQLYLRLCFPYVIVHKRLVDGHDVKFYINNPVERFRLQDFGGEKKQMLQLLELLRPNDVLYDIGASVGAWSIPAAMKLSKGTVVSFEPDPENLQRLKKNFELNGLRNYQLMEVAIGDRETELELFTSGAYGASPSLKPVNKISTAIKVPVKTIDDLLQEDAIPKPTVVKIDIEGAEMMALRGMQKLLLSEHRPRSIVLEVHPLFLPSFDTDMTEVFALLINAGYRIGELIGREDQVICTWHRSDKQ